MYFTTYLTRIHRINENIPGTRHDNLFKHVPIQKWDIKKPHPRGNNPRVPKNRLQQTEYHIWSICTSIYMQHYHHQAEDGRSNHTKSRKQMWQILFYAPIHRKDIHTFIWTEIPINEQLLQRVNDLATKEKHP